MNDLAKIVKPGDCVLVKGSNSVHLDAIAAHLARLGEVSSGT